VQPLGEVKIPNADLLATSRDRGWTGIAAEWRRHPAGEIPNITPEQMEVTLAIHPGANGVVERRGNGRFQATPARPGTLWLCPISVREDSRKLCRRSSISTCLRMNLRRSPFRRQGNCRRIRSPTWPMSTTRWYGILASECYANSSMKVQVAGFSPRVSLWSC
jgi:hypothetical protein